MVGKLVTAVGFVVALSGCSLRLQSPVVEVPYDFSDRDFYDRAYAPSPAYGAAAQAPESRGHARRPRTPEVNVHVDVQVAGCDDTR